MEFIKLFFSFSVFGFFGYYHKSINGVHVFPEIVRLYLDSQKENDKKKEKEKEGKIGREKEKKRENRTIFGMTIRRMDYN